MDSLNVFLNLGEWQISLFRLMSTPYGIEGRAMGVKHIAEG